MSRRRKSRTDDGEDQEIVEREEDAEIQESKPPSSDEDSDKLLKRISNTEKKIEDLMGRIALAMTDARVAIDKAQKAEDIIEDLESLADELDEKLEKFNVFENKFDNIIKFNSELAAKVARLEESRDALEETVNRKQAEETGKEGEIIPPGIYTDEINKQIDLIKSKIRRELNEQVDDFILESKTFSAVREGLLTHNEELKNLVKNFEEHLENHKTIGAGTAEGETLLPSGLEEKLEKRDQITQESINAINDRLEKDVSDILPLIEKISERVNDFEEKFNSLAESINIDELIGKIEMMTESQNASADSDLTESLKEQLSKTEQSFDEKINELIDAIRNEIQEKISEFESHTGELSEEIRQIDIRYGEFLDKQDELPDIIREEIKQSQAEHEIKVKEIYEKVQQALEGTQILEGLSEKVNELDNRILTSSKNYEEITGRMELTLSNSESNIEKINSANRLIKEIEEKIKGVLGPANEIFERIEEFEETSDGSELGFDLNDLLQVMIKHQASDLHIKEGAPPTVRLEGDLVPVGNYILTNKDCKFLIFSSMNKSQIKQLFVKKEIDFPHSITEARFMVNAFLQKSTVSASYRMLKTEIPPFEELQLPPVVKKFADLDSGLILFTGPASSGKSTTLASVIDYLNTNRKLHILTIENPIEYIHHDKLSLVTQREIGTDTPSFSEALRNGLKQDPNVIILSELGDRETIMNAVIAAESGHLVIGKLNTLGVTNTVQRLIDSFPEAEQKQFRSILSTSLKGIISQRLINRADNDGFATAFEILVPNQSVSNLIYEGRVNEIYTIMAQGITEGMQTFAASLTRLYEDGIISREEVSHVTSGHSKPTTPQQQTPPPSVQYSQQASTASVQSPQQKSPNPAVPLQEDSLMSWL